MKSKAAGILVVMAVLAVVFAFASQAQTVSGAEARKLVASGAVLLDVRTPGEFSAGHIEKAVNIPVDELPARTKEVGGKDSPVVVYCHSGRRSARAAETLKSAGFSNVHDLGAMSNW